MRPRRSAYRRSGPGSGAGEQVLAANVDVTWVVHGLDLPPNLRRLERYLAVAWESGSAPDVVLNKRGSRRRPGRVHGGGNVRRPRSSRQGGERGGFPQRPTSSTIPEVLQHGGPARPVGGGNLAGQFHDAGLLDEIIVQVASVTLGGGVPFLPRSIVSLRLRLTAVEAYGDAFAELRYDIVR